MHNWRGARAKEKFYWKRILSKDRRTDTCLGRMLRAALHSPREHSSADWSREAGPIRGRFPSSVTSLWLRKGLAFLCSVLGRQIKCQDWTASGDNLTPLWCEWIAAGLVNPQELIRQVQFLQRGLFYLLALAVASVAVLFLPWKRCSGLSDLHVWQFVSAWNWRLGGCKYFHR